MPAATLKNYFFGWLLSGLVFRFNLLTFMTSLSFLTCIPHVRFLNDAYLLLITSIILLLTSIILPLSHANLLWRIFKCL